MKDYSYIGVAEDLMAGAKILVRSKHYPICEGDIVVLNKVVRAEVIHSAFLQIGCDEEAMLAEFGEIHEVEKIYSPRWEKPEEVTEDGN